MPHDQDSGPASESSAGETDKRIAGTSSSRRVLQLLLSFSERRPRATVAELSEWLGVPAATTYRYVALLKELQLVEEAPANSYQLTSRVMPLARAAQVVNDLARVARPTMEEASRELRETVMLFQLFGGAAVCVERVECDRPMRFTFEPGHSMPLGVGASGKMLLACLPVDARRSHLAGSSGEWLAELEEELRAAAERGHALSFGELDEGVWACSVPVLRSGRSSAVLSLAGPEARIPERQQELAVNRLADYAKRIRERIDTFSF